MARGKDPHPGTLKKGLITGSRSLPSFLIIPLLLKRLEATKKGNNDGKTILSHNLIPLLAASIVFPENITRHAMKIRSNITNRTFFTLNILIINKP